MRRNNENTYNFIQASHKEILDLKTTVAKLEVQLQNVCLLVQNATFFSVMQGADLSEFFPVRKAEQLKLFMDRDHPDWPSRRTEFYHYLYSCVSDSKKTFTKGLLKALFSREYMWTVKWPSTGYYLTFLKEQSLCYFN